MNRRQFLKRNGVWLFALFFTLCLAAQVWTPGQVSRWSQKPAAGASGFDPSTVSAYTLDYDVDALGLSDGNIISSLTDKGAGTRHLIGATGPYWTNDVSVINGKAWANFDGSTQWLQTNFTTTFNQPNTYFVVCKLPTQVAAIPFIFDGGSDGTSREAFYQSGSWIMHAGSDDSMSQPIPTVWMLLELHYNGSSSSVVTNGVAVETLNPGTGAQKGFTMGCRYGGSPETFGLTGGIARLIMYNSDVSGADLTAIRNYCRTNYSLW